MQRTGARLRLNKGVDYEQAKETTYIAILMASLLACGGGTGSSDADAGPDQEVADADPGAPPSIVSVTPEDGAVGVAADADITIVFSKAMDQASVEDAWVSSELPVAELSFSWNAAGDTVTITPEALPVAEGEGLDPDVVDALTVGFEIGTSAADLDGQVMEAALAVEFATVRRLEIVLAHDADLTDERLAGGGSPPGSSSLIYAGDTNTNDQVKVLITFDLPDLPAGASLESGNLSAELSGATGTPTDLGELVTQHVTFTSLITDAFSAVPHSAIGTFSSDVTPGPRSIDVTAQVADDLNHRAERSNRSQYRLEFATPTINANTYDTMNFTRSTLALTLSYVVE